MSDSQWEAEQPDSAASSSGRDTEETSSTDPLSDFFVRHKLTKTDTLPGLAVRYNVTVSDIKRANGLLADQAMYAKETLLIPTRPLPVGPEYSAWAGMIVTHYGRLGVGEEGTPSELAEAHLSQTRNMQRLRGYYSTGPSRSHSPQYGSDVDGDRHHLFAASAGEGWRAGPGSQQQQQQQVELMERSTFSAAASYIEERLRRRRGDSQQHEPLPTSSSAGEAGGGGAGSDSGNFAFFKRQPLFGSLTAPSDSAAVQRAGALASAGGKQLRQYGRTLLGKLKKVASQPALAAPAGSNSIMRQVGQAAVVSAPGLADSSARERQLPRQRSSPQAAMQPKSD